MSRPQPRTRKSLVPYSEEPKPINWLLLILSWLQTHPQRMDIDGNSDSEAGTISRTKGLWIGYYMTPVLFWVDIAEALIPGENMDL